MTDSVSVRAPIRGAYDRSLTAAERDRQQRERLLAAGAALLRDGPPTVAAIVLRAGVGRNTFYRLFDSPEQLIAELERSVVHVMREALERALAPVRTPTEQLNVLIRGWMSELERQHARARPLLRARHADDNLTPLGILLLRLLTKVARTGRGVGPEAFHNVDDLTLLAATAAVEAIARRHLSAPVRDVARIAHDTVVKLLR
jgi:AcrR family transcriptional regulator